MAQGIALTFNSEMTKSLVELQNLQAKIYGLSPVQGVSNYLPHITLLQAADGVSLDDMEMLQDSLDEALNSEEPNILHFTNPFYKPGGWYFLGVQKHKWIERLHDALFQRTRRHLVQGEIDRNKPLIDYSEREKDNYWQYGYRYIGDAWIPHVTIGRTSTADRLSNEESLLAVYTHTFSKMKFQPIALTVYQIGISGGHARTILSIAV